MKRIAYFAALVLLFACKPESNTGNSENNNNNGGGDNNNQPTVVEPTVVELTGIALTKHEITLEKGGNEVLEVEFTPENATNKALTWVSSNTSVVTVADGIVVGVAPGTTEIIVKSGNYTDRCQVTVVVYAESVSLDQTALMLAPGGTATLKATVLPEDTTYEVEWSSSDETVATVKDGKVTAVTVGEATITAKAGKETATCSVNVVDMKAVDLGLPVKWATCNVGASKPEEYGDYFAWGEVDTKERYDWESYKWGGTSSSTLTKYCPKDKYSYWAFEGSPDGKTVLEPEDDAAHVMLGGKWRMPTMKDWSEIKNNCTFTWTTQNDVDGILATGKNGNSIFLPAAGYREGDQLIISFDGGEAIGAYWDATLDTYDSPDCAYSMYLVHYGSSGLAGRSTDRSRGLTIRPVTE